MLKTSLFILLGAAFFFVFVCSGIIRFGLLGSFSDYSPKWAKALPMNNTNIWDIITMMSGVLLCPPLLEMAMVGSSWQFLGLLAPIYMIITALKPQWNTSRSAFLTHSFFTLLGSVGTFIWAVFVMHSIKIVAIVTIFYMTIVLLTGTIRKSYVLWTELWMFVTTYLLLLFALI